MLPDSKLSTTARRVPAVFAAFLIALLVAVALPGAASAEQLEKIQHGGRATAQAGALTARADEPSAVTYNPAAITRLNGLQVQGGLDFQNDSDDYDSTSGSHRAKHTIQFPATAYVTWRPEGQGRLAYGLGVDTPIWYRLDWRTALFPGRFRTRVQEVRLYEVHPVAAFEMTDKWSVGGGVRYLFGSLEYGFNTRGTIQSGSGAVSRFELESLAQTSVDAVTFDLGVHYDDTAWGFGAVYKAGADLTEEDGLRIRVRDIDDPSLSDAVLSSFSYQRARQGFEMPDQLHTGVWIAPYPELRVELDAVYSAWSSVGNSDVKIRDTNGQLGSFTIPRERNWDDTVSLRLGVEGDLTDTWSMGGGIAWQPSPVPNKTAEPGFPRGDTLVYAIGGSYNLPQLSIDVGYSIHDFDDRSVTGQEFFNPAVRGTYSGHSQVWSASARWRFGR